jgi:hypothetical protein
MNAISSPLDVALAQPEFNSTFFKECFNPVTRVFNLRPEYKEYVSTWAIDLKTIDGFKTGRLLIGFFKQGWPLDGRIGDDNDYAFLSSDPLPVEKINAMIRHAEQVTPTQLDGKNTMIHFTHPKLRFMLTGTVQDEAYRYSDVEPNQFVKIVPCCD